MFGLGGVLLGAAMAGPSRPHRSAGRTREGGTLRIAAGNYGSVDPAFANYSFVAGATCALLMSYPDKWPPGGTRVVPEVATGYPKISRDARTYTFRIRRGFRFSTGARLTAANFAYAIDRLFSPDLQSPYGSFFDDIVGARAVEDGKAKHAAGVKARGLTLSIRLMKPAGDFLARLTLFYLCPVPTDLPIHPGGVNDPPPSAGPYYVAEWIRERKLVLKRNPFYGGRRPHHLDGFVVTFGEDADTITREIDRNQTDWGCCATSEVPSQAAGDLGRKYGVKGPRFFVRPWNLIFYLALNTQRPLFRNNPGLRRAVNFALDRSALVRARGRYWGTPSDGYLPLGFPGAPTGHLYPLKRPNFARARALARGHRRSGTAVLYALDTDFSTAQARIVQTDLKRIGIRVIIKQFPFTVLNEKVGTRGEAFDLVFQGWSANWADPSFFINWLLDGRRITKDGNFNVSYFNVPRYNRLMARAARLSGSARYRAYRKLARVLARDAAPLAVYATWNSKIFVSNRVGCAVRDAYAALDLAAACLK
jgi:peptide/nickel transport system substrate-binding protein